MRSQAYYIGLASLFFRARPPGGGQIFDIGFLFLRAAIAHDLL
jgi:hypothetical protein